MDLVDAIQESDTGTALAPRVSIATVPVVVRDLASRNPEIAPLMKAVWILAVLYSGPIGLWVYWTTGRKQIREDSIWRRGGALDRALPLGMRGR